MNRNKTPLLKNKTEYWRFVLLGCLACVLFVLLPVLTVGIYGASHYTPLLDSSDVRVMESGWRNEDGESVGPTLKIDPDDGMYQSFYLTLPDDGPLLRDPYFMLTVRYYNVRFFVDGVPVGECIARPEGTNSTQGAIFFQQPLPTDYAGKELRIDVELLLGDAVRHSVFDPMIGSRSGLLSGTIQKNAVSMVLDLFIIFIGLGLLTFGLLPGPMRKEGRLLSVGTFAVSFSLYSMCVSGVGKLFLPNTYFAYLMEFLLLAVLPIPLLLAYLPQVSARFHKLMYGMVGLLIANLTVQLALHLFTPLELRNTVWMSHLLIIVTIVAASAALIDLWRSEGQREPMLICMPIAVGVAVDLVRFYVYNNYSSTIGIKMGVLIFVILQTVTLVETYLGYYERELQNKFYQRMAFTDILTGLGNRAAFERREAELRIDLEQLSSLWCACADLNDLKKFNDTHGHAAGDELLRGMADVLRMAAEGCGTAYRTGGDEFVIFFANQPDAALEDFERRMAQLLKKYNDTHGLNVSISIGLERLCADGTDSVAELVERADQKMYDNKRAYHAIK